MESTKTSLTSPTPIQFQSNVKSTGRRPCNGQFIQFLFHIVAQLRQGLIEAATGVRNGAKHAGACFLQNFSRIPGNDRHMADILIVEDDESVRFFTARALAAAGHHVETAEDGRDGLERLASRCGAFDLVLSDIRMPVMDGIEMAKTAASTYPGLKILLMTGYAEQRERADELAKIIVDVVQKPFTLAQIRQGVARAIAA